MGNISRDREVTDLIRMDIQTVVVGGGPVSSLIVLKTKSAGENGQHVQLPIRIGTVEATAISMGIDDKYHTRPMTHDLLASTIDALGGTLERVEIVDVRDTTFFANLVLSTAAGRRVDLDARPSDAIALAVRTGVPIYASERVIETATLPDFASVEEDEKEQELEDFHNFVESLSPEDFNEHK